MDSIIKPIGPLAQAITNTSPGDLLLFFIAMENSKGPYRLQFYDWTLAKWSNTTHSAPSPQEARRLAEEFQADDDRWMPDEKTRMMRIISEKPGENYCSGVFTRKGVSHVR